MAGRPVSSDAFGGAVLCETCTASSAPRKHITVPPRRGERAKNRAASDQHTPEAGTGAHFKWRH